MKNRDHDRKQDNLRMDETKKEDFSSYHFTLFGPRSLEKLQVNDIKPTQEDLDSFSEGPSEGNRQKIEQEYQEDQESSEQKRKFEVNLSFRTQLVQLENEVRYLKSQFTKEFDKEKLKFISDILTKYFLNTPKLSSGGKTSSIYTDFLWRTSTQEAKTSQKPSPHLDYDSDDSTLISSRPNHP